MKTAIDIFKEDLEIARRFKHQDQIDLIKLIIGECDRIGKDLPNDRVLGVMQKILKNAKILHEARPSKESAAEIALMEECIGKFYVIFPETKPLEIDLDAITAQLIDDNPSQYAALRDKPQNIGWFVGQVMKATNGKADPAIVKEKILDTL